MNQEIDCGLMAVSRFDMQELQERTELLFSPHCGSWYSLKETGRRAEPGCQEKKEHLYTVTQEVYNKMRNTLVSSALNTS